MTAKQWLTIEDWLECTLPLCKLLVRHEGRPERCENDDAIRICFASSRVGGDVLIDGDTQVIKNSQNSVKTYVGEKLDHNFNL